MQDLLRFLFIAIICVSAHASPGLFLAKDGSKVTSQNSKVIMSRKGEGASFTFTSDFESSSDEVVLIVPVPEMIKPSQVTMVSMDLINAIDQYTSPRLIEYVDFDPCDKKSVKRPDNITDKSFTTIEDDKAIGLKIDEKKVATNIEVIPLTSKESVGLEFWLRDIGYNLSSEQLEVLKQYANTEMRFVVFKIKDFDKTGAWINPMQIKYDSKKFVIPAKIGALNLKAQEMQNMTMIFLSSEGEVASQNIKEKDMPVNIDLPTVVLSDFDKVYGEMSAKIFKAHPEVIRREYAWPINACKPCTSAPLSVDDLIALGVSWYHLPEEGMAGLVNPSAAIYVTRLQTRYDLNQTADNIVFAETNDRPEYQAYFNIKNPIAPEKSSCKGDYEKLLKDVEQHQNEHLNDLIA